MPRFKPWNPQPAEPASETLLRWLSDLVQDLRHAARQFARTPALAALIVATLAIGIGATVTMAGVIDRLLFRGPAEVHDSGRLARLVSVTPGAPTAGGYYSYP